MNEEIKLEEFAPWLAATITVTGGLLRVFQLGNRGLWLDETFSLWLANQSVPDMLQWMVRIDQHPPLYYLLLHYWIAHYGDTPYYARLLSVLFGTLTIPVIYLIGRHISGAVVGLAAAVILALSPFNIYYAQETRMYTLLMFNASVAIYALVRLLTDAHSIRPIGSQFREYLRAWRTLGPVETGSDGDFSYKDVTRNQRGWRAWIFRHRWNAIQTIETDLAWVVFIVFSAATLLTHNTAVFFPLATNIFVLGLMLFQRFASRKTGSQPAFQAPTFWNWVKAQIGILLLWSPWISVFIQQARRVDKEFWIPKPTWEIVTQTFRTLLNASAPGQFNLVISWALCAVLCFGLLYYRKKLSIFFFLAALFAIPVLGELIVSIRRPIFMDRTLIWITIPLVLLLAAGIAQLRFRLLMIAVLGIVTTNYMFSNGDIYRFVHKEDWSSAAGYVANFAQKDDLILFNSNFVVIAFDYYFKPFEELYSLEVVRQGVPLDLFESGILEPRMTTSDISTLLALLNGHNRVWLVYSHDSYTDPMGLIPQTLASQMKLIRKRDCYGVQVRLYETP
jgi:mannosyltransferase